MHGRKQYLPTIILALMLSSPQAGASYAFYVGKHLTENNATLIGGTGEEVSSHWLAIVPRQNHGWNATLKVGVTEEASIPGELISIPQTPATYRYITMFYSQFAGFPAPLTNGGINEHQVAVRDVWAPSRRELVAMTATPQKGLNYSDLARLVLERAKTAREGVELIGELIAQYGYATYGGNTHLIADPNEGWVVWELAGGQGLWAAERLGADTIRVLYPGYIERFPLDYKDNPDYRGSDNLIRFAEQQGWYDADAGQPFNVFKVYGVQDKQARSGGFKYLSPADIEQALREKVPVSEREMMAQVRDYRIADDEAGYGQVASLRKGIPEELIRIWVAPTGAVAAPFLPWWIGVQSVPPEYRQHRYLTKQAGSTFLNRDYQLQEATEFAGRVFKRVMYYACANPKQLRPMVQARLTGFENNLFNDLQWLETSAKALLERDHRNEANQLLTFYAHSRALEALELGNTMADWLDAYIKTSEALHLPGHESVNNQGGETVNCLPGYDPDKPKSVQVEGAGTTSLE